MTDFRLPATIVCEAPPLESGDTRLAAFFDAVRRSFAGIELGHAMVSGYRWQTIDDAAAMEEAEQFVVAKRDRRPIIYGNGSRDDRRLLQVTTNRSMLGDRHANRKAWNFRIAAGEDLFGDREALSLALPAALAEICTSVGAYFGQAAMPDFLGQWRDPLFAGAPSSELPSRQPPPRSIMATLPDGFVTPTALWWVNYWSDSVAAGLGFPDPARDAESLELSARVQDRGWILKITDRPLDLRNSDHAACFNAACVRFAI